VLDSSSHAIKYNTLCILCISCVTYPRMIVKTLHNDSGLGQTHSPTYFGPSTVWAYQTFCTT